MTELGHDCAITSNLDFPRKSSLKSNDLDSPDHPMYNEKNRLKSYGGWPVHFLRPLQLTKAGFYYTHKEDIVRCAFCNIEIGSWNLGDDPVTDHILWSRNCKFMNRVPCGNVPMNDDEESGAEVLEGGYDTCGKYGIQLRPNSYPENEVPINLAKFGISTTRPQHQEYASYDQRIKSFADWPVAIEQKPAELAQAGFYYIGKGDQVVCFYCNGGLKDWQRSDVPWEQHARWFSTCNFLRSHKTQEYISDICKKITEAVLLEEEEKKKEEKANVSESNSSAAATTTTTTSVPNNPSTSKTIEEKPTKERTSSENKAIMCKICYGKDVGVVFLPCGHMIACVDCAPSLEKCAVCRQPLQATVRAFLS